MRSNRVGSSFYGYSIGSAHTETACKCLQVGITGGYITQSEIEQYVTPGTAVYNGLMILPPAFPSCMVLNPTYRVLN